MTTSLTAWPSTRDVSPPTDHLYRSATWLLGRHPRLALLAARIRGVVVIEDGEPAVDLDHLADVLSAATPYAAAWEDYEYRHRPPEGDDEYETWRQAGPKADSFRRRPFRLPRHVQRRDRCSAPTRHTRNDSFRATVRYRPHTRRRRRRTTARRRLVCGNFGLLRTSALNVIRRNGDQRAGVSGHETRPTKTTRPSGSRCYVISRMTRTGRDAIRVANERGGGLPSVTATHQQEPELSRLGERHGRRRRPGQRAPSRRTGVARPYSRHRAKPLWPTGEPPLLRVQAARRPYQC